MAHRSLAAALCAVVLAVVAGSVFASTTAAAAFVVRRNVLAYGAVGDGVHDDTAAFIAALTQDKATNPQPGPWNASQYGCQTTRPSIVVVPPGTYKLSAPLPLPYYSQLVGTANGAGSRPRLAFTADLWSGAHALDAGIDERGHGWYPGANQDNFYRQLRNVVVDISACTDVVALHWQVSQGTNIVNVAFELGDPASGNVGIAMENGSGGYMGDLTFAGGVVALQVGNQQFTVRNVSIVGASTGVLLNWGWSWAFHDLRIRNASVAAVQLNAGVSAVSFVDLDVDDSAIGVLMDTTTGDATHMTIDGAVFGANVPSPLIVNGTIVVPAAQAATFVQARFLNGSFFSGPALLPARPAALLAPNGSGKYFGMTRPNYDAARTATALLVNGSDVTAALRASLASAAAAGMALFIPYGTYFLSATVVIPVGSRVFGEVWTRFAPIGAAFQNASAPIAMLQVGNPGDVGVAQLADLLLTTAGPAPGAILLEWHARGEAPGDCGVWDLHFRIGGAVGTGVSPALCPTAAAFAPASPCVGAHTLLRIGAAGSLYAENVWGWVADHSIDGGGMLNVFNARGLVVEAGAAGPVWLYGTAMEHSYLFQYSFASGASNILISIAQTETAYYQPAFPLAASAPGDPEFYYGQEHGWAMAAANVSDTVLYGSGFYSFFFKWQSRCGGPGQPPCQQYISEWTSLGSGGSGGVRLHNHNTHAAAYALSFNGQHVEAADVANGFCATASHW